MTYLAVPVAPKDVADAVGQIKLAQDNGAEMLELRVDYLDDLSTIRVKEILNKAKVSKLPLILTCRDNTEGGMGDWPLSLRTDVLVESLNCGVEFIDCEFKNFIIPDVRNKIEDALSQNPKARIILSAHNFEGPWEQGKLDQLYEDIKAAYPQAIPKLVYTATHINDCFEVFDLLHNKDGETIVLCMGSDGLISRILTKKLGGFVTFASVCDDNATAPGQITVKQLKNLYRWDHLNTETEVFGVIGDPIGHSLSPAIFNASFDAVDLDALYLPILVKGEKDAFNEFLDNIVSRNYLGFGGFSVTIPHKTNALDYVNAAGEFVEPLAENIGAINTLKVGFNGIISGYNTDYSGAMDALMASLGVDKHGLHGLSVAVIGAGGAARAVVAGLADVGAKITIYNRTVSKARFLAEEFACRYAPLAAVSEVDVGIIINCTSIGMYPETESSALGPECIKPEMVVFDTVYNPLETLLLKYASQVGAKTINGAEMFIRQAMAQFKIFTGSESDEKVIRKTVFDSLAQDK
jgi:3-dehydroquinate dehydratase/shikimate dehydrogenase